MMTAQDAAIEEPEARDSARPRRGEPGRGAYVYDPRSRSPILAGFLSLMPGLGQVYVGYYQRGFIHMLVAGGTIALLVNEVVPAMIPLLGLFLAFFWLYNIIDAGRRASLYNMALQGTDPMALPEDLKMPASQGSVAGGVALIGIGVLLLMHTLLGMSLDWLREWWPLVPVLVGAWLVYKGMKNGAQKE